MMREEISKVLNLVKDGKLEANKGAELISVLKDKEEPKRVGSDYLSKSLKIRVVSESNDNVNVTLPIKLVKAVLKAGHGVALNLPQSEKYARSIDIDLLIDAIENELDGQIVDVTSANGDKVAVIIE